VVPASGGPGQGLYNTSLQPVQREVKPPAVNLEEKAVAIFRLLSLLLPPENRRKLQLLLKFIRKVR
jgi:hypothetical protein